MKKIKGKIRITEELTRRSLGLPEDVMITDVEFDSNRDIITFHLRSNEPMKGYTYEVLEGFESLIGNHTLEKE